MAIKRRYFTAVRRPTKGVQLACERKGDGMIIELVAADAAVSNGNKMAMKSSNDGDDVHTVLNFTSIGCCFSFGFIGAIGNGFDDMTVLLC